MRQKKGNNVTDHQPEINRLQIKVVSLQQRQIALNHQFNSAAIMRNGSLMDQCRADIHAVADEILDTNARIYALIVAPFAG